jgi:hypothetical protein
MKQIWQARASSLTFFSEAEAGALQNKPFKTLSSICTTSESYVFSIVLHSFGYKYYSPTPHQPHNPNN